MRICLILLAMIGPASVWAETDHRVAFLGAADSWITPEDGYHGAFMVSYDVEGLSQGAHFQAAFNTDTLTLSFDRLSFWDGRLEAGLFVKLEYAFAGLLMDHYIQGKNVRSRGFQASYLLGGGYLKANLPHDHYLTVNLGVRRWFFNRRASTAETLVLPPEAWVFEPRLDYTYWTLQPDASLRDRHRLYPRIRGWAAGISLGLDFRSKTQPWGAVDEITFDPVDFRNRPEKIMFMARQWLRAGWQLNDWVRTQVFQSASFGSGEDDLTRVRIGGLNPYVIPLAGAPWAAFLADKFVAVESSWHFRIVHEIEAGLLFQGALIEDVDRIGRDDVYGFMSGLGMFLDARLGDFQVDLRGGWSPTLNWENSSGQFSLFGAMGWQWD